MTAAGLAELESEKARRHRAKKAAETRWKPEQECLQAAPSRKHSPKEWSRPAAAKSAGVSERKVRQAPGKS